MKQRTSFILKGLISLVLSLVMLCGTAVTSLSAVTVDNDTPSVATDALSTVSSKMDTELVSTGEDKGYYVISTNNYAMVEGGSISTNANKLYYDEDGGFYYRKVTLSNSIADAPIMNGAIQLSFTVSTDTTSGHSITATQPYHFEPTLSDFSIEYTGIAAANGNATINFAEFSRNPKGLTLFFVYIPENAPVHSGSVSNGDIAFLTGTLDKLKMYQVTVQQKLKNGSTFVDTIEAATITSTPDITNKVRASSSVTLSQTSKEGYTFLGWYVNDQLVGSTDTYKFNVTADVNVEARYEKATAEPVMGKYIFKYEDRNGQERTVSYERELLQSEITGYSGNGNQKGVPTYIWNDDAKAYFPEKNPLLKAALVVQGNNLETGEFWKDVDVYKNTIAWAINDNGATNLTVDATNHTVTVSATVTKNEFTVYLHNGNKLLATVENVAYGEVVTFLEQYDSQTGYHYVNKDILPEGVKYWSSDPDGEFPLTTNPTFGMVIRGDKDNPTSKAVNVYLQTRDIPDTINTWNPEFEEAQLTYSNDDKTDEQKYYADYLANYFSKDGVVIQDVLKDYPNSIKYGVIVVKSDADVEISKDTIEKALGKMRSKDYTSAALKSDGSIVAYRDEHSDSSHISNFNRTWYTFTFAADGEKMKNKKLTAMAYIDVGTTPIYTSELICLATADLSESSGS